MQWSCWSSSGSRSWVSRKAQQLKLEALGSLCCVLMSCQGDTQNLNPSTAWMGTEPKGTFPCNCSLTSAFPCTDSIPMDTASGTRFTAWVSFQGTEFSWNCGYSLAVNVCVSSQWLHSTPQGCLGSVLCVTHFSGGEIECNGLKTNHCQSLLQAKQDSKNWKQVL